MVKAKTPGEPLGMLLFAATELEGVARQSILEGIELNGLVDLGDQLTLEDRIFLALTMNRLGQSPDYPDRVLAELKNHVQVTAAGATVAADIGSPVPSSLCSSTRATALTLLLMTRSRPEDPLVAQFAYGLLGLSRQGRWGSTQDNLLALLALTEFRERFEKPAARANPFTASMSVAGRALLEHRFNPNQAEVVKQGKAPVDLSPGMPATLTVSEQEKGNNLYYGAVLRWEEPALGRAADEGGFTLSRRVERLEDATGTPKLGELVRVTLICVIPRESWYLALRDPLPAGLEIVHTEFQTESQVQTERLERGVGHYEPLPMNYVDARDREVRVYADYVAPGVFEYRYLARVRAAGMFGHPPATLEAMYAPELNAASASSIFEASP
jgi:uncharacterized protein YfaS (alpha-2-macroglobulin family)